MYIVEAMIFKSERHTGARSFVRSGAIDHDVIVPIQLADVLFNVVIRRDPNGIVRHSVRLRPCMLRPRVHHCDINLSPCLSRSFTSLAVTLVISFWSLSSRPGRLTGRRRAARLPLRSRRSSRSCGPCWLLPSSPVSDYLCQVRSSLFSYQAYRFAVSFSFPQT